MSIFPEISPDVLAVVLATITGCVLIIIIGLALSQPILWRMGWRHILRRPTQTTLLVCGLALSTVVITASFGLSDSFNHSAVRHRLGRMGNVDESVSGPFSQARIDQTLARLRQDKDVAAVAAIGIFPSSPTVFAARTGFSVHNVDLYALTPQFESVYGTVNDEHGQPVHFTSLHDNVVFVSSSLAQSLHVHSGDSVQLNFGDTNVMATVQSVLANDIGVTTGEAISTATPEVLMSLSSAQKITPAPPDTICIKNVGSGGLGTAATSTSRTVIQLLQQLFPGAPASLNIPQARGTVNIENFRIHPLKPDVVLDTQGLSINKIVFLSSAGQQFSWLPPLFSCLLVGAGLLLLVLLIVLMTAERRTELGMSRALGLQRYHLVEHMLFEGCGYAVVAALLGLLVGAGVTALEIVLLSNLPTMGTGEAGNAVPIPIIQAGDLYLWISWQSLLNSWCIGVLTTIATVLVTSIWMSRMNIVTAIRNLDEPLRKRTPLMQLWRSLGSPQLDLDGQPVVETMAHSWGRVIGALCGLLWGWWVRGPLCLLAGVILLLVDQRWTQTWLVQCAAMLLVAGGGLFFSLMLSLGGVSLSLARRLCWSVIGLGWLVAGLILGNAFLTLFQPVVDFTSPPSALEILLSLLLLVVGAVVLVMSNADLLTIPLTALLRRIPGQAAVSRLSLVYPLTFRFRTGITVALLSLITFLVLMLVTTNLGALQVAQAATNSGGFQIQATVFGSQLSKSSDLQKELQALSQHQSLTNDFSQVGLLRIMYDFPDSGAPAPLRLLGLSGQPLYRMSQPPLVADDAFLSNTTLQLYARAQGFSSDQQVWSAVRDQRDYVVLQYDSQISALPMQSGFAPFSIGIPDNATSSKAHYHQATVIGLMPASTPWRVLTSLQTSHAIVQTPSTFLNTYLFRLRPPATEAQAVRDLSRALHSDTLGITIQSLDQGSVNEATAVLTIFLVSYLALGLGFGALAISVITSRAVVERRQQIGMLRALGFSRFLVWRAFLLESSFTIFLGLLVGTVLAVWLAYQVAVVTYQHFPFPAGPVTLIVIGSFLIALVSTVIPTRRAAKLHPAEALRYE